MLFVRLFAARVALQVMMRSTLAYLRSILTTFHAKVRRDGERAEVPAEELVPGDIVLLEAGD